MNMAGLGIIDTFFKQCICIKRKDLLNITAACLAVSNVKKNVHSGFNPLI